MSKLNLTCLFAIILVSLPASAVVSVECLPGAAGSTFKYFYLRPVADGRVSGQFFVAAWSVGQRFPRGKFLTSVESCLETVFQTAEGGAEVELKLPLDYLQLENFSATVTVGGAIPENYKCNLSNETIGPRRSFSSP